MLPEQPMKPLLSMKPLSIKSKPWQPGMPYEEVDEDLASSSTDSDELSEELESSVELTDDENDNESTCNVDEICNDNSPREDYLSNLYNEDTSSLDAPEVIGRGVDTKMVSEIDWATYRPNRSGVIVYTWIYGMIHVGLGLDRNFNELTDFGGGIKYHKDKDALHGALREFMEESLFVFGPINTKDIQNSLVTLDDNTCIVMLNMNVDPYSASALFRNRANVYDKPEVTDIVWLPMTRFIDILKSGVGIYSKVRDLLVKSPMFNLH